MSKEGLIKGLHVLLGISGGIAAYKSADLASKLTGAGAQVRCVMTESACKLILPKTFEAVTGEAVYTSLWSDENEYRIGHVKLAEWADVVVVAPATANIIGKAASGICDEVLSTTLCTCWKKPVMVAPAMNVNMWNNPVVQGNVEKLRQIGWQIVGPREGRLACGVEAMGRMAEPSELIEAIEMTASEFNK